MFRYAYRRFLPTRCIVTPNQRRRARPAAHQDVATITTPIAGSTPGTEINALITGVEYLKSLGGAREVYIYGERAPRRAVMSASS
jgi:hypothetical protein